MLDFSTTKKVLCLGVFSCMSFASLHYEAKAADINPHTAEFIQACADGNMASLSQLKFDDIDVNAVDHEKMSALMYACWDDNLEVVQKILEYPGVEVNKEDDWGTIPLMVACAKGNLDIVQALWDHMSPAEQAWAVTHEREGRENIDTMIIRIQDPAAREAMYHFFH